MFNSGLWYRDNDKERRILRNKLNKLNQALKKTNEELVKNGTNKTITDEDQEDVKQKQTKAQEIQAQINVLQNAMREMGFSSNNTNHNIPKLHNLQPLQLHSSLNRNKQNIWESNTLSPKAPNTIINFDGNIMNGNVNTIHTNSSIQPVPFPSPFRVQSSNLDRTKGNIIHKLNEEYEHQLQLQYQRRRRRLRSNISNRIYHIEPDWTEIKRSETTDNKPTIPSNDGHTRIEHVWVETIDDALQTHIDGDIIELSHGEYIISGQYPIYGRLTIRGTAESNWKTVIVNKSESVNFLWCIGKDTRVTLQNLSLRCCGGHNGIIHLSLRAQFIGHGVSILCNGFEGINMEHGSKIWLSHCLLSDTVGAGIHINVGCKCLLTHTKMLMCGQGDWQLLYGQGAIVIYGFDIDYAKHLVTYYVNINM